MTSLMRITPSELKQHRTPDDAWSAFGGKVYNITPYLAFHPGGEKELMRVAGRDGTKLFGAFSEPSLEYFHSDNSFSSDTFLGQHRLHARWMHDRIPGPGEQGVEESFRTPGFNHRRIPMPQDLHVTLVPVSIVSHAIRSSGSTNTHPSTKIALRFTM